MRVKINVLQAYRGVATGRRPYKMRVLKMKTSLTRSNFITHQLDFDMLFIALGATHMPNFEVLGTVVWLQNDNYESKPRNLITKKGAPF